MIGPGTRQKLLPLPSFCVNGGFQAWVLTAQLYQAELLSKIDLDLYPDLPNVPN